MKLKSSNEKSASNGYPLKKARYLSPPVASFNGVDLNKKQVTSPGIPKMHAMP